MANILSSRWTHSGRLERWLGPEAVENMSKGMRDWYGPPIAVSGVPGSVWACAGGDFKGPIKAGQLSHTFDYVEQRIKKAFRNAARRQKTTMNAGFSSLSDLIAESTAGKRREFWFRKVISASAVSATDSLWRVATYPAAGAAAAAAPGGTVPDDATAGAHPFVNPTGGDTQHFVVSNSVCDIAGQNLLLYDRLFAVAKTMSSTATEAVTGVPTRYQSTTGGAVDSAEGNFLFIETGTTLSATAHNHTVCLYKDQAAASSTMPSMAGISSSAAERCDMPLGMWFAPLESGDRGVQTLTQMQTDASVTGALDFVIGHPIAWLSHPAAAILFTVDGINTAFNLVRIFDDAALAFLAPQLASTSTSTFTGSFATVAG